MSPAITAADITGLILAGGRGQRMGGIDKGLAFFDGLPLAQQVHRRLAPQVGSVMISANRNLAVYAELGVPVWPDAGEPEDHAGPLAGFLAGLAHCLTPWLLSVPCDSPLLPLDLAERLAQACAHGNADLAVATAPAPGDVTLHRQPVFCLMRASLLPDLETFMQGGGRKVGAWMAGHRVEEVAFDRPGDHELAFSNVNTLQELEALQRLLPRQG